MNREELFKAFQELFPDWARIATSYKKIGSKTLAIRFKQYGDTVADEYEISRVFLYVDQNNWHFGTKLWRKRPEKLQKKKKVKKEEKNNEV